MTENYPPYHYYVCSCDPDTEYHKPEDGFFKHLKEKHSIEANGAKVKKELILHINRRPRHAASYKLTFDNGHQIYEYYG